MIEKEKIDNMKNKKGFTLVELLAVIAILAVLMLLIMPNVLKMFTKGKKDTFKVQVESIIKVAETQSQTDTMSGNSVNTYCNNISSCTSDKKLDISDSNVKYIVTIGSRGLVSSLAFEDSNYCYVNTSNVHDVNEEDFVEGGHLECSGLSCSCSKLSGSNSVQNQSERYVYWTAEQGGKNVSYDKNSIPTTTFDNIESLNLSEIGKYIRTKMENDEVVSHEACFYYNGKSYCIKPDYWETDPETTKNKLKSDMEEQIGVASTSCTKYSKNVTCNFQSGYCGASDDGSVYCTEGVHYCSVTKNGSANCT